jgi:hypothetical protein
MTGAREDDEDDLELQVDARMRRQAVCRRQDGKYDCVGADQPLRGVLNIPIVRIEKWQQLGLSAWSPGDCRQEDVQPIAAKASAH